MLEKSDEIYRLVFKYIKDIANNIEQELDDLLALERMAGFINNAPVECTEFIQSHVKLLKKFLDEDIEEHHGKRRKEK